MNKKKKTIKNNNELNRTTIVKHYICLASHKYCYGKFVLPLMNKVTVNLSCIS